MLFITATLSKNQLYKLEKQINNISTDIKQDHIARVIFQIFRHVILLMSSIYFRVTIIVVFLFAGTGGLC